MSLYGIIYDRIDQTSSNDYMGSLFRCSNVYIAPYQAEGFNLPVLESLASGTPVIVPKGGCTDDFTHPSFARYIAATISEKIRPETGEISTRLLNVSKESLMAEMRYVLNDHSTGMKWLKKASKAAAKFSHKNYEWRSIVQSLFEYLRKKNVCLSHFLSSDEL